jgi:hypothetical protein
MVFLNFYFSHYPDWIFTFGSTENFKSKVKVAKSKPLQYYIQYSKTT